jgi:RNA polymerase sigma factor (sigma-70 family)
MAGRRTRPWGPLKGASPQENQAAVLLRAWMDEADLTLRALHSALASGPAAKGPVQSRATVADRLAGLNLTGDFIDAVAAVCFSAADAPARAQQGRNTLNGVGRLRVDLADAAPAVSTLVAVPQSAPQGRGAGQRASRSAGSDPQLSPDHAQLRLNVAELHRALSTMTKDIAALRAERDEWHRRCQILARALSASESTARKLTEQLESLNGAAHEAPGAPKSMCPKLPEEDEHLAVGRYSGEEQAPAERSPCSGPVDQGGEQDAHYPPPNTAGMLTQRARGSQSDAPLVTAQTATLTRSDSGTEQAVGLPPAFEAFFAMNGARYTAYARLHLREDLAEAAVHAAFLTIVCEWEVFLGHPEPAAWAWQVLRRSVAEQAGTVSLQLVLQQAMRDARATLDGMTSELGLFTAIAELPERQFDVIVLRYVLGYTTRHIAELLGLADAAVRQHQRRARERLATKLGLRTRDDPPPW